MRLFLAAALLVPSIAFADTNPPVKAPSPSAPSKTTDVVRMKNDDCARARAQKKQCVLNIDDGEKIEGVGAGGEGVAVGIIELGKASSLIRLRKDFIMEILKTAEDIE